MAKRMNRVDRMRLVVRAMVVYSRWQPVRPSIPTDGWFTMWQIAYMVGMKPSSHMRRILKACVKAGWLMVETGDAFGGVRPNLYSVSGLGEQMIDEIDAFEQLF